MGLELNHDVIDIGIIARDEARAKVFYGEVLGLPVVRTMDRPDGNRLTFYQCGKTQIKVWGMKDTPAAESPGGSFIDASGIRYFTIRLANLKEILDRVEAAGFKIARPAREFAPSSFVAFVQDGDGNHLELIEEPPKA